MSILRNHAVLMLLYALATAAFFALLWRQESRARLRFFRLVFAARFLGGLARGGLMYPFPRQ